MCGVALTPIMKGRCIMTISFFVSTLAEVLVFAIIARALLSWFPGSRTLAPVSAMLNDITNPILSPIRRRVPPFGGLDLSPIVAILLVGVAQSVLLMALAGH